MFITATTYLSNFVKKIFSPIFISFIQKFDSVTSKISSKVGPCVQIGIWTCGVQPVIAVIMLYFMMFYISWELVCSTGHLNVWLTVLAFCVVHQKFPWPDACLVNAGTDAYLHLLRLGDSQEPLPWAFRSKVDLQLQLSKGLLKALNGVKSAILSNGLSFLDSFSIVQSNKMALLHVHTLICDVIYLLSNLSTCYFSTSSFLAPLKSYSHLRYC